MKALPRLSALGFAMALAGCDGGSDSKADAPPSTAEDADEKGGEKSARADEGDADKEPKEAGADDSGPDEDLYAPFVDESRRDRRPDDTKPLEPPTTKPSRGAAPKDQPPVTAETLGRDGAHPRVQSGRDSTITTPDGKTLKVTKGGTVSLDRLQAHPR